MRNIVEQAAVRDVQEACVYDGMGLCFLLSLVVYWLNCFPSLKIQSGHWIDLQGMFFLSFTPRCNTVFLVPSTPMLSGFVPVKPEESVSLPSVSGVGYCPCTYRHFLAVFRKSFDQTFVDACYMISCVHL